MSNNNNRYNGASPSSDDADLLAMIRQHLAEAEQNIKAEKQRRPVDVGSEFDLLELDNLDTSGGTGGNIAGFRPPRDTGRVQISSKQPTLENIWNEGGPRGYYPQDDPQNRHISSQRAAAPPERQSPPPPLPQPAPRPQNKAPAQTPPPQKIRSKKRHPVRRFISAVLIICLLAGSLGFGLVYYEAGKVRFDESTSDTKRPSALSLRSNPMITNILLLGVDGDEDAASLRSDTMLLLSIDYKSGALKLTSFLRDSWVTIADGGEAKLNAAFARGGAEMVMATLEQNFGVRINQYLLVDYTGFENVITALGGVAVPVTDKEADFLCDTTRLGKQIGRESMRQQMDSNGVVLFNGEQALIYCRIRKLDSDFKRTERQQKVLNAIVDQLKEQPLTKLLALPDAVLPCIRTDMTRMRLTTLLLTAPFCLGFEVERHTVPAKDTYKNATKQGSSVLSLDIEENSTLLKEFIYE